MVDAHPFEDELEAYLMGQLPGQVLGREHDTDVIFIEEHLLWCQSCLQRAAAHDELVSALRTHHGQHSLKVMVAGH